MLSLSSPFGEVSLSWYGLLLGSAIIAGYYWCCAPFWTQKKQKDGQSAEEEHLDLLIPSKTYALSIAAGLLFAKLSFLAVHDASFQNGLDTLGGIFGVCLLMQWLSGEHFLRHLDRSVTAFFVGSALCSFGRYLSGFEYGKALTETTAGWLTQFAQSSPAYVHQLKVYGDRWVPGATQSLSVHPTTLYDFAAACLLGVLSVRIQGLARGRKCFVLMSAYFVWVGLSAGLDSRGVMQNNMRLSAVTGLVCVLLLAVSKRHKPADSTTK